MSGIALFTITTVALVYFVALVTKTLSRKAYTDFTDSLEQFGIHTSIGRRVVAAIAVAAHVVVLTLLLWPTATPDRRPPPRTDLAADHRLR